MARFGTCCGRTIFGDFLFLETALLTETLWMFLIAAGLWAATSARISRNPTRWLIAAGALLALATVVRSVALPLVVLVAVWAVWELEGKWRRRLIASTAVLIPFAVIIGGYSVLASQEGGYSGIRDMAGFNLYARIGQFANCRDFTPPQGTAPLCENTPASARNGPFYYTYGVNAPIYRAGLRPTRRMQSC